MLCLHREPQQRYQRQQQRPLSDRVGGAEVLGAQHLLRDALLHGAGGYAADARVTPLHQTLVLIKVLFGIACYALSAVRISCHASLHGRTILLGARCHLC